MYSLNAGQIDQSLLLKKVIKWRPNLNPFLPTPNPKQNKAKVNSQNTNINIYNININI
jgi:hypothetical protein